MNHPSAATLEVQWSHRRPTIASDSDEVHLWRVWCPSAQAHLHHLETMLSADEISRAEQFRFPEGREYFTIARGMLRGILGRYLGRAPEEVCFCYGPHGKPALAGEDSSWLHFNLSHSSEIVLYAVSRNREVGVDVERIQTGFPALRVATQFFSAREVAALQALPAEARPPAFFACWTAREAYAKATGQGLALSLDDCELPVPASESVARIERIEIADDLADWSLRRFCPAPGYAASVAAEGPYALRTLSAVPSPSSIVELLDQSSERPDTAGLTNLVIEG